MIKEQKTIEELLKQLDESSTVIELQFQRIFKQEEIIKALMAEREKHLLCMCSDN